MSRKRAAGYTVAVAAAMFATLAACLVPGTLDAQSSQTMNGTVRASATILSVIDMSEEHPGPGWSMLEGREVTTIAEPNAPEGRIARLRIRHSAHVGITAAVPAALALSGVSDDPAGAHAPPLPVDISWGFNRTATGGIDGYFQADRIVDLTQVIMKSGTYTGTVTLTIAALY